MLIVYCLQNPKRRVSIVRKSFPALSGSVGKDLFEVLDTLGLYEKEYHNKSNSTYKFPNGSYIELFSVDDSQKLRGRKRDLLFINEANELDAEEFLQLNMRTTEKIFIDFNPSFTDGWIYDLINREETTFIHSTYKDNSFLEKRIIKEIENLVNVDQDYYNVYCLGLPSKSNYTVFNHQIEYVNRELESDDKILGLDFGFQHPTALMLTSWNDNQCYVRELLYASHLTVGELVTRMKLIFEEEDLPMSTTIACDYARPEIIEDLVRAGFNAVNAIKNVKEGIDAVKSTELFVHKDSFNTWKEFKNYKWKVTRDDKLTDEVVKLWDDAMDAMRYAILYHKRNTVTSGSWEFDSF
jgi:phage terminase large subunit